ncbi:MAG: hypothetical protein ACTSRL_03860 [Candidatus Helarchaeota archaeon]
MIHNLYIIKSNGICVFHKKFGSLDEDPQSVSGFLTAVSMFSKAIIGEEIKVLATDNYKFIFHVDSRFIFVSFIDKSDHPADAQKRLKAIKNLFYRKFPEAEKVCESGNLTLFETFKVYLENNSFKFL